MADDAPSRPSAPRRVSPVVWVLIGLGVPALLAIIPLPKPAIVMEHSQEMAALQQLVTIQRAQTRYFSRFVRFATKLEDLGPTGANLVPADLAKGIKGGYQFTVIGGLATHAIALVENCLFIGCVRVARRQTGCVRFCHVPPGSRTVITSRRFIT